MEFSQVKIKMQASDQVFVGKAICHLGETQLEENDKEQNGTSKHGQVSVVEGSLAHC